MKRFIKSVLFILTVQERNTLISLIVLDILISILDISFLALLLYIINFYVQAGQPVYPGWLSAVFSPHSVVLIGLFFLLFGIKNLLGFFVLDRQYRFIYGVASRISEDKLLHYMKSGYLDYIRKDSSVHIRTISQQPVEFGHYVLRGLQQIISQCVLILVTIIAIVIYNAAVFLLLFAVLTPAVILLAYLLKRKLSTLRQHAQDNSTRTIQYLQEALNGFVESNIYNLHEFFIDRYSGCQREFNRYLGGQQVVQGIPSRLIEVFAVFGLFILILINSYSGNALSIITIGAFTGAAYKIIPGIVRIMNSLGQIKTYAYTISDLEQSRTPVPAAIDQYPVRITNIELANVSFTYDGDRGVRKFSMAIEEGDIVGISGISGKGKTTIVNLLLGFLMQDSGSIYFNNVLMEASYIRRLYFNRISYVKQQPFFIHDTLLKNITLNDREPDAGKLDKALKLSGIQEILDVLTEGLNYAITENGRNLSGGQRQRVLIARALYRDFDLLILDEPFSELDERAERSILEQLKMIAQAGKLILLITHSRQSLLFCNKVISLDAA